ncbi:hypothetical protein UPYG_G00201730 [Umbra pygmaea]|uniref:Uncharacterized protein n=1 Tax=Umbra pygmaea TaxID=75934 RepID=A0ABD0WNN3_UMBPY
MWHGAKNLAKKIAAAAKIKGQSILFNWLKNIVNHFWWCCKTADTREQFLHYGLASFTMSATFTPGLWEAAKTGPLNQSGERCGSRDSQCHKALVDIVLNKSWQKDVHKYLRFRSTADLESFHNHILMYASKRYAFSPPV